MSPGEKRRRQAKRDRDRAAYAAQLAPLKAAGASCGSCKHFGRAPMMKGRICEVKSDFHGYTAATADGLCPSYEQRRTP